RVNPPELRHSPDERIKNPVSVVHSFTLGHRRHNVEIPLPVFGGFQPKRGRYFETIFWQLLENSLAVFDQITHQRIRIHGRTPSGLFVIAVYSVWASAWVFCSYLLVSCQSLTFPQFPINAGFANVSASR